MGLGQGANATLEISDDLLIDLGVVFATYSENSATQFEINESQTIFKYIDFGGRTSTNRIGEIIFPISMQYPNGIIIGLFDIVRAYFYDNPITFTELPNALQLNWSSGWTYSWVISTTTGIIIEQIFTDNNAQTLAFNLQERSVSLPAPSTSDITPSPVSQNSTDFPSDSTSSNPTSLNTISLPYPSLLLFLVVLLPIFRKHFRSST